MVEMTNGELFSILKIGGFSKIWSLHLPITSYFVVACALWSRSIAHALLLFPTTLRLPITESFCLLFVFQLSRASLYLIQHFVPMRTLQLHCQPLQQNLTLS